LKRDAPSPPVSWAVELQEGRKPEDPLISQSENSTQQLDKAPEKIDKNVEADGETKADLQGKESEQKLVKRNTRQKEKMENMADKLSHHESEAAKSLAEDDQKMQKTKQELQKLQAEDKHDEEVANAEARAAKVREDAAASKREVDDKMTLYEENLKQKIEMEVNGPFKERLQQAMRGDLRLKQKLEMEMLKPKNKAAITEEVAKILKKKFKERLYTVGEAKELQNFVYAQVSNKMRNKLWTKVTNEAAHSQTKEHANDSDQGIYLRKGHQLSKTWAASKLSEKEQKSIRSHMKEDDERESKAEILKVDADDENAKFGGKDPRHILYGGPKPWYNRSETGEEENAASALEGVSNRTTVQGASSKDSKHKGLVAGAAMKEVAGKGDVAPEHTEKAPVEATR